MSFSYVEVFNERPETCEIDTLVLSIELRGRAKERLIRLIHPIPVAASFW